MDDYCGLKAVLTPSAGLANSFFFPSKSLLQSLASFYDQNTTDGSDGANAPCKAFSYGNVNNAHIFKIIHPARLNHHIFVVWFENMGTMKENTISDKVLSKFITCGQNDSQSTTTSAIGPVDIGSGPFQRKEASTMDDPREWTFGIEWIHSSNMNKMFQVSSLDLVRQKLLGDHSISTTQEGQYTLVWNIDSVNVKPLSYDDYEILELHKDTFSSQMLSQHRVLSKNTIFPFWIADDVVIYMEVTGSPIEKFNNPNCIYVLGQGTYFIIEKPKVIEKSSAYFEKYAVGCSHTVETAVSQRRVWLNDDWAARNGFEDGDVVHVFRTFFYVSTKQNLLNPNDSTPRLLKKNKGTFGIVSTSRAVQESNVALDRNLLDEIGGVENMKVHIQLSDVSRKLNIYKIYAYLLFNTPNAKLQVRTDSLDCDMRCSLRKLISSHRKNSHIPLPMRSLLRIDRMNGEQTDVLISINAPISAMEASEGARPFTYFENPEEDEYPGFTTFSEESQIESIDIEVKGDAYYLPSRVENIQKQRINETMLKFDKSFESMKARLQEQFQSRCVSTSLVSYSLLSGSPGSGKTVFAKCLCEGIHAYPNIISCSQIVGDRPEKLITFLRAKVAESLHHSPSILIFDDFDFICPSEQDDMPDMNIRLNSSVILDLLTQISEKKGMNIACIFTVQSKDYLHKSVQDAEIFENELHISNPGLMMREKVIHDIWSLYHSNWKKTDELVYHMSVKTEGFSMWDIKSIIDQTIAKHQINVMLNVSKKGEISMTDFDQVSASFHRQAEEGIKLVKVKATWEDVGGLESVINTMRETFEYPSKYPEFFSNAPLKLPSGILLYGPTGCGKTYLAQIAAGACGLNFISVKGPEILNKYIGQSEENVRNLFQQAESAKPCILFFDEFDSIGAQRGQDTTGVTDRVVNQFLCQMDGVESREGVYVLAATSRPDLIDAALLRPGRLDKALYCGFPSEEERLSILKVITRKINLHEDVDLAEIARLTNNFTGADLQGLISNASIVAAHAFDEKFANTKELTESERRDERMGESHRIHYDSGNKTTDGTDDKLFKLLLEEKLSKETLQKGDQESRSDDLGVFIHMEHIFEVLKDSRPSVGDRERRRLEGIYARFQDSKKGNSSQYVPPREGRVTLA